MIRRGKASRRIYEITDKHTKMTVHDAVPKRGTGDTGGSAGLADTHAARVICITKPQLSRASLGICAAISQENMTFSTDYHTIDAVLMKMTQKTADVLNLNNS
ncbi:hypothetical protein SDC9_88255 [bioreactor metagenome]|uniref:Uncharacterized protein n=2 Tax=root TaxID=1 RepID=A0A644ZL34_9ZZZZ